MSELLKELFPTNSQIQNYILKNTPEQYKFLQKVFQSFLEALYSSETVIESVKLLNKNFDPKSEILIQGELSETSDFFTDPESKKFLMWARIKKNLTLFKEVGKHYFSAELIVRYTPELLPPIIHSGLSLDTDIGLDFGILPPTIEDDLRGFFPVILWLIPYTHESESFKDLKNQVYMEKESSRILKFWVNLFPARIPMIPLFIPVYIISMQSSLDLTIINSPFEHIENIGIFNGLSDEEIVSIYNDITESSVPLEIQVLQNSDRMKRWRISQKEDFETFSILPGTSPINIPFVFNLSFFNKIALTKNLKYVEIVLDFSPIQFLEPVSLDENEGQDTLDVGESLDYRG